MRKVSLIVLVLIILSGCYFSQGNGSRTLETVVGHCLERNGSPDWIQPGLTTVLGYGKSLVVIRCEGDWRNVVSVSAGQKVTEEDIADYAPVDLIIAQREALGLRPKKLEGQGERD